MLAHLLDPTLAVRAGLAAATALAVVLVAIPRLAALARRRQYTDRDDKSDSDRLNALHAAKRKTPIVGGLAMVPATALATLLWADLGAACVWVLLATLVGLAALGLLDDVTKTFGAERTRGLSARQKLVGQVLIGAGVTGFLLARAAWWPGGLDLAALTTLDVPFVAAALPLGVVGFAALGVLVVTGSSNAVNLTDGLDGLAGGCALIAAVVFAAVAAVAGDAALAGRLGLVAVPGAAEVTVVLAGLTGALTGFLVHNRPPQARVFMGDTGSLPLGGVLAVAALLTKQELLLAVVGGVFVAEAVSVMVQVGWFKLTGRRVLRCAPLHHHFEFGGWGEAQVVTRFHAAALLLAALGLAGLGVR